MTLPLFFAAPGALQAVIQSPVKLLELDGDEGRHAVSVKRIQIGEQVLIADGDNSGLVAQCEVTETRGKDKLVLRVIETSLENSRTGLTVVLALIKGERMERAIEQLTEVGVGTIIPWASERSVVSLKSGAGDKIHKRLERKAFEAAKQCRQPTIPGVSLPVTTAELEVLLRGKGSESQIVVLHEKATCGLQGLTIAGSVDAAVLIIGPEGGLADQELAAFEGLGGQTWLMGASVMRAGTAAVVASGWLIGSSGAWDNS